MFRLGNRIPDKRNALHDSQSCETARRGRFAAQRCRDRRARQPGPFRLLSDSGPTIGGSERLSRANSCRSNRAPSASAFSPCAPQSRQAALGQLRSRLICAHCGRSWPARPFSKADIMSAKRFRQLWVDSSRSASGGTDPKSAVRLVAWCGRHRTGCFGQSKCRSGHFRPHSVVAAFGQKADISECPTDIRFAPKSGHLR